jgi:hypothetical protein
MTEKEMMTDKMTSDKIIADIINGYKMTVDEVTLEKTIEQCILDTHAGKQLS